MNMREVINLFEARPAAKTSTHMAWHGTSNPDIDVRPWVHFGSERAAAHRLLYRMQAAQDRGLPPIKTYLIGVELTLRGLTRVTDDAGYDLEHSAIVDKLMSRKRLDPNLRLALEEFSENKPSLWGLNSSEKSGLANIFEQHGIDGFVYRNGSEDRGSESYVVLNAKNIRITTPIQEVTKQKLRSIYYRADL